MKFTCIRAYPLSFRATVYIQGLSFDGTSSSKKIVRYYIYREACTALSIET